MMNSAFLLLLVVHQTIYVSQAKSPWLDPSDVANQRDCTDSSYSSPLSGFHGLRAREIVAQYEADILESFLVYSQDTKHEVALGSFNHIRRCTYGALGPANRSGIALGFNIKRSPCNKEKNPRCSRYSSSAYWAKFSCNSVCICILKFT